jgi:hypothetical protein
VIRVVLDTNVLVSALLFGGMLNRLVAKWKSCEVMPIFSRDTYDEFRRVLAICSHGVGNQGSHRRRFLLEIRDLWSEFAIDMGVLTHPVLIKASRRLERFLYRKADHILVIPLPIENI